MPAKFKGAIDRVFLPGFSFKYVEGKSIPKKLLKGRTSELLITLDTAFWYKYIQGFGIKNKPLAYFGPSIKELLRTLYLIFYQK